MIGNHAVTVKSVSAEMETLYEWPKGSSLLLLDFAERVLCNDRMSEKVALQKKALEAAQKVLNRQFQGSPREYRDVRDVQYRADDGSMRSLSKDIEQCAKWLQVEGGRRTPPPLKAGHWIVWNLAPFFRKKAGDSIEWRNLVKFLNCVSASSRLAGKRSRGADRRTIVAREAKRMEALYKRIPPKTGCDVKVQRVLNKHFRHRTDSPNKPLHDRAFQTLSRLTS